VSTLSPSDLDEAPELAILLALAGTIDIARAALFAANPQLQTDYILEVLEPAVQVCLADAIMMHLDGLRCSLERYRNYVENADARTRAQLALRPKANPF